MDIGSQQRVIIVETEQFEPVKRTEPDTAEVEARLVDLAEEEWPLPVEIDPAPVH